MRKGTLATLIAILGAALAGALKWIFDHFVWDWLTHYLEATFGWKEADVITNASSFVVPLVIVVVLIGAIYRIARDRPVLTEPQPDMRVSNAIDYIVNDSRAVLSDPPKKLSPPPWPSFLPAPTPGTRLVYSGVEHREARKQVNSKLISGELRSWGLRQIQTHIPNQFEHSLREIPKEYWDDMQLDFQSCLYYKGLHSQTMKIPGRTQRHDWAGIQVSKQQIEQLWPKKSPARRLWSKISRNPRIGYTRTVTAGLDPAVHAED